MEGWNSNNCSTFVRRLKSNQGIRLSLSARVGYWSLHGFANNLLLACNANRTYCYCYSYGLGKAKRKEESKILALKTITNNIMLEGEILNKT